MFDLQCCQPTTPHVLSHLQVLAFCEALADATGLREHLVLHTRVLRADPILPDSTFSPSTTSGQCCTAPQFAQPLHQLTGLKWRVVTETHHSSLTAAAAAGAVPGDAAASSQNTAVMLEGQQGSKQQECVFDAVASCVGIFSEIQLPQVRCVPVELACGSRSHAQPEISTPITQVSAGTSMCACCMLEPFWGVLPVRHYTPSSTKAVYHILPWFVHHVTICGLLQVPGVASWPGLQLHSHNYRGAEEFRGQQVMVVGASFSGQCKCPATSVSVTCNTRRTIER
jgi:hypothetical protein